VIVPLLDYCDALLTGTSKSNFKKLQRVQNTLARVVFRQNKIIRTHNTSFKRTTLATGEISCHIQNCIFSCLNKKRWPTCYLRDLVPDYEPFRSLPSSSKILFCKRFVSTTLASGGFRHSADSVWNSLLNNIRDAKTCDIFKRRLKTHRCEIAFGT